MNEAGLMAQPAIAGLRPPHIAHRRWRQPYRETEKDFGSLSPSAREW